MGGSVVAMAVAALAAGVAAVAAVVVAAAATASVGAVAVREGELVGMASDTGGVVGKVWGWLEGGGGVLQYYCSTSSLGDIKGLSVTPKCSRIVSQTSQSHVDDRILQLFVRPALQ